MLLGIDSMEVYEFYSQLEKGKPSTATDHFTGNNYLSTSSTSPDDHVFDVCQSCLKFAEEMFRTALSLVLEHEGCQTNFPATIDRHWEKGQHLLLRGRAHHNIGHAIYELAQCTKIVSNRQRKLPQNREKDRTKDDLLNMAKDEFAKAVQRARSIRHNAVLICGHPNANDTSGQSDYTWIAEAAMHQLESMKLETLAGGFHILSSWSTDGGREEAVNMFHGVFQSVEISDVLTLVSAEGVTPVEIAEVLGDLYWLAMRVAELSAHSLEGMSIIGKDWSAKMGEDLLQITRLAMQRASEISDHLLSFVNCHSLVDYGKEGEIATSVDIRKEENELCQWWDTIKKQATTRLSDIATNQRSASLAIFQRSEIAAGVLLGSAASGAETAPLTRRVFIQDDRALQDRSLSCRTMRRRINKKNTSEEDRNAAEQFSSEFSLTNDGANTVVTPSSSKTSSSSSSFFVMANHATTAYRKWGNEILEPHERKKQCCPPLPENFVELGISIEVIRSLEWKLGHTLPENYKRH